jgi:FkbM family methyltransferase
MTSPRRLLVDLRYHLACLVPWRRHVHIRQAPLGLQFHAYKRDVIGRLLYKQQVHEPALTQWLIDRYGGEPAHASPPRLFVDIGANIGYFSALLARLAGPQGRVIAFEPEPANQSMLRQNLALNQLANVRLEPVALGAENGSAVLHRYKASNRGRHSLVAAAGADSIEVPVRRLDDLLPGDERIDLMKIDVEGYEPYALAGAERALARTEVLAIEFSPDLIRRTTVDPGEFLHRLAAGFDRLSAITPDGVRPWTVEACLRTGDQTDLILEKRVPSVSPPTPR